MLGVVLMPVRPVLGIASGSWQIANAKQVPARGWWLHQKSLCAGRRPRPWKTSDGIASNSRANCQHKTSACPWVVVAPLGGNPMRVGCRSDAWKINDGIASGAWDFDVLWEMLYVLVDVCGVVGLRDGRVERLTRCKMVGESPTGQVGPRKIVTTSFRHTRACLKRKDAHAIFYPI